MIRARGFYVVGKGKIHPFCIIERNRPHEETAPGSNIYSKVKYQHPLHTDIQVVHPDHPRDT